MTAKRYEIAVVDEHGEILARGGISATLPTVRRWVKINEKSLPCPPGEKYAPVEASEEAITYEEYLEECREAQRV